MPARRVTRCEAEAFLRRLEGREGADRERLVREHREYIDGTRDHDADFGDEEQKEDATSAPHTPTKRPRMTVTTSNSSAPRHQKKRTLSTFYDMLAKMPELRGKMPVAALNAEELAEQASIAESELDDDRDEDYDESAEAMSNDDAEYLEATTPPATSRSNPSPNRRKTKKAVPKQAAKATGKGKRKRAALTERSAVKRPRTESPHLAGIDSASRYVVLYCRRGFIRANYLFVWLFLYSEASLDADFGTGSALTSPARTPLQLAQQTAACSPTPTPHRTSTARYRVHIMYITHADTRISNGMLYIHHDVKGRSIWNHRRAHMQNPPPPRRRTTSKPLKMNTLLIPTTKILTLVRPITYEEMGELLPPGGTAVDSDSEYDSGDENAETATPPAGESLASSRAASPEASSRFQTSASDVSPSATARRAAIAQKKQERERWKAFVDN
ncbi:unnamed protein product [Phytophthora fragariaefolia]|uniref:Unnamed protein product n=1 Tax=Phytophthora fragariaefolia TaxID=1490495 RepID=A0A9W6TJ25_9STRA|nr:unnamed protein product [Phytophthora fragariaefolia]